MIYRTKGCPVGRLLIGAFSVFALTTTFGVSKPLKVYILAGQSNMQGHARTHTLAHIATDPAMAPLLAEMQTADGELKVCEPVWISYLSTDGVKQGQLTAGFGATDDKFGPEWGFGIGMAAAATSDEPILIIKTAWGGKSLHTDFRPPSAGPYEFPPSLIERLEKQGKDLEAIQAEKREATGHYYRLMIGHVREVLKDIGQVYPDYDPSVGYQLGGFVWFQGWNDMVDSGTYPSRDQPGGYDAYTEVLGHLIRDVRRELETPEMPFVIGVMGVNGPVKDYGPQEQRYAGVHQNFRDAMAAPALLPEFAGTVKAVLTENCWDSELQGLMSRKDAVKQALRKKGLKGKEAQAYQEELMAAEFSQAERRVMDTGISNLGFHYLGSGKIIARIGTAFAEAMQALSTSP